MILPKQIRELRQWINWELVGGNKLPLTTTGNAAKTNDPKCFSTFDEAQESSDKIAFVIQASDEITGVDLDNCLDGDGMIRDWALPIVAKLSSVGYGEVSPSGTGIKFLTIAKKPEGSRCVHKFGGPKEQVECYDFNRFWTVTGDYYEGSLLTLTDGQEVIDWLCKTYLSPSQPESLPAVAPATLHFSPGSLMDRGVAYSKACQCPPWVVAT